MERGMDLARRIYSREVKIAAMREIDSGRTIGEVARQLELSPHLLDRWRAMRKRFSHGFLIEAYYTHGKAMTYGGSEEGINDLQDKDCTRCSRSRTTLSLS